MRHYGRLSWRQTAWLLVLTAVCGCLQCGTLVQGRRVCFHWKTRTKSRRRWTAGRESTPSRCTTSETTRRYTSSTTERESTVSLMASHTLSATRTVCSDSVNINRVFSGFETWGCQPTLGVPPSHLLPFPSFPIPFS